MPNPLLCCLILTLFCRIFVNCRASIDCLQYTAPAFTTGVICITALSWLVDLSHKLAKDGPGSFRSRVSLSLQKTKPQIQSQPLARSCPTSDHVLARSATGPLKAGLTDPVSLNKNNTSTASAQEALAALLAGASSPFIVQSVDGLVVMEAESTAVVCWLCTAECADLLYLAQVGLNVQLPVSSADELAVLLREAFFRICPKSP